ncbi:hypothetical protein TNCV_2642311 [Trichonephila clavipes]|nr:hypothetical protein TNCV_2642311 [Trichonephila clavipes]
MILFYRAGQFSTCFGSETSFGTRVNGKFAQFCVRVKNRTEVVVSPHHPESSPWSGDSEREGNGVVDDVTCVISVKKLKDCPGGLMYGVGWAS